MPVGDDTYYHRRYLPHLEKSGKRYFITWATRARELLPAAARDIALECCVYEHLRSYWLEAAVIMPDHVHIIIVPDDCALLSAILNRVKGVSAHRINTALQRKGHVWQREYFDRILRSDEDMRKKGEYVCNNPVRAGLVATADDYPWIWRSWVEGRKAPPGSAALHDS